MPVDLRRREEALRVANQSGHAGWSFFRGTRNRSRARPIRTGSRRRGGVWRLVLPALLLVFVLRTFVVEAYMIPSRSMESTLLRGDFLLVNKLVYGAAVPIWRHRLPALRQPVHNDLIVFDWPVDPAMAFVKRLVGLPGDTVAMTGGVLIRNGTLQMEAWTQSGGGVVGAPADDWGPVIVPPHHYFVLGDNRDNSLDSRTWGFVPDSLVRGAPWVVYFSFEPDSTTPVPWLTRIRWPRLGISVR